LKLREQGEVVEDFHAKQHLQKLDRQYLRVKTNMGIGKQAISDLVTF
jgi:hypothetical protein